MRCRVVLRWAGGAVTLRDVETFLAIPGMHGVRWNATGVGGLHAQVFGAPRRAP